MGNDETLSYSSYLKVPELISLQEPLSRPVAHDELLFIIIHQTYELWFKQVIFELESIIQHIENDRWFDCFHLMNRVSQIFRVLIQQIDILETMTAEDFNQFRSNLNPASGFQSGQFREFELLAGIDPQHYAPFMKLNPEWKTRIQKRARLATLRSAFLNALDRHGLTGVGISGSKKPAAPGAAVRATVRAAVRATVLDSTERDAEIRKAMVEIYSPSRRNPENTKYDTTLRDLRSLCEGLIGLDEQTWLWRFRHLQMVERMIGMKPGTGGSLGASYLETTLKKRLFPELWDARTQMGGSQRPAYGALRSSARTGLASAPAKRKGAAKSS